jgi:hypothetical protein
VVPGIARNNPDGEVLHELRELTRMPPRASVERWRGVVAGRPTCRRPAGGGTPPEPVPLCGRDGYATIMDRAPAKRDFGPDASGPGNAHSPNAFGAMSKTGTDIALSSARLCFHGVEYRIWEWPEQHKRILYGPYRAKNLLSIFYRNQGFNDNCR